MQFRKVNSNTGLFVADVILPAQPMLPDGKPDPAYVIDPVPPGLHWPKRDFATDTWVEGLSAEEIAARQNQSAELTGMEKLKIRLDATEDALLFLMDMNMGGII